MGNSLVIRSRKPREGWAAAFREMAKRGDDVPIDDAASTSAWDAEEWEWRGKRFES